MKRFQGRAWLAVLTLAVGVGIAAPAHAGWLDDLWMWVAEKLMYAVPEASPEAKALQADIERYRAESRRMEPKKAAEAWLALYDRAKKLGHQAYMLFDAEAEGPVGVGSMFAALPAPEAWPLLREAAKARAAKAPGDADALALRVATELLTADRAAAAATIGQIEALAKGGRNEDLLSEAAQLRAEMAQIYGTREEIAATFVASLDGRGRQQYLDVEVPDLVGLVGEARAAAMLREALAKPVKLHVPEGAQTRALARRIALEQVASLTGPQWGLADAVEAGPLYEAMDKRFKSAPAGAGSAGHEYRKAEADRYYFLYLVMNGRHADAEKAMDRLIGQGTLYLPKREIEALQRARKHEELYGFLHALLARRPQMNAWEVYMREAAGLGKSAEALALVEQHLARKDLTADWRVALRFHRADALLAADKVDAAVAELRTLLAEPPKAGEAVLQTRINGALRLSGLGRVLERPELTEAGLAFARAAIVLPADRESSWGRAETIRKVFAEVRKAGRGEEALALAKAELERKQGGGPESRFVVVDPNARAAAAEIAGIHGQAKRHRDALAVLNDSPMWGARDLRELLAVKDSLGVPVALTAARALAETGSKPQAIAVARALIDALPGHDPAYELLIAIDPDAHAYLDKVYAADQFEERPLIWKAILYTRSGRWLEAESLIRQAITIDPSDGEEGANDRMRAYAVLAEVLEAKGAKGPAATFRGAVRAIRISERSDELYSLGLYARGLAGYRQALAQFADAYCIQSRLAIRLMEQGRREEAFQHYRRAYELMPASFGRVESHCFGCESVFQGPEQQALAESVFSRLLARDPRNPQIHYLLGYLNKDRGRLGEAVKRFGESVRLDPDYLNAWKHLNELAKHYYVEPRERDRARLKLLALDPRQRHVRYELDSVGDLAVLWKATDAAYQPAEGGRLYPLRKSAEVVEARLAAMPDSMRGFASRMDSFETRAGRSAPTPSGVLGRHKLVKASVELMQ